MEASNSAGGAKQSGEASLFSKFLKGPASSFHLRATMKTSQRTVAIPRSVTKIAETTMTRAERVALASKEEVADRYRDGIVARMDSTVAASSVRPLLRRSGRMWL